MPAIKKVGVVKYYHIIEKGCGSMTKQFLVS